MSHITEHQKQRYASASKAAKASVLRHPQLAMDKELTALANYVTDNDMRDAYGSGGTIEAFEQELSQLFAKASCVFLPTGTLAQCVAMKCFSEQSGKNDIGLHPTSHLLLHEHMAVEHLWQLNGKSVGNPSRVTTAEDLSDLNSETLAAIILEVPMREIGGALPTWQSLLEIRHWCDVHGVKLHLDGARIWQVTDYYQRSLAEIAALFDSLYVSFYKDLNGVFGAALLGEKELIDDARIWARRAGGNPITLYPEVIAAKRGLNIHLKRMPDYVRYTKALCQQLSMLAIRLEPEHPEVSMFHLKFDINAKTLVDKIIRYAELTGVIVLPLPRSGDQHSCVCEITIGENALEQPVEYWVEHINNCIAN